MTNPTEATQTFDARATCYWIALTAVQLFATGSVAAEELAGLAHQTQQLSAAMGSGDATPVFQFTPEARYAITSAVMRVTDIVLQPGETIGSIASGDTVRWIVGVDNARDSTQHHVFIKPTKPGLETNMIIRTNRRTYLLDLRSVPEDAPFMVTTRWTYPKDERAVPASRAVSGRP